MSPHQKTLYAILIIVLVIAGGYFGWQWYDGKYGAGSAVFSEVPATLPSGTSTTDDSLAQDAAAIDAELKALDGDSASADASIKEAQTVQ